MSTSTIEIHKDALENNINFIREQVGPDVRISPVIKGNAYGHGIDLVVPVLESFGIDHFSVFSSEEAKKAYSFKNPNTSLMVMGYIEDEDFNWIVKNNIEHYIFEISSLLKSLDAAKAEGNAAIIHLELETGMHRTGLNKKELKEAIHLINENPELIRIKGITTHLAGAESMANYYRIMQQLKIFDKRCSFLKNKGIEAEIYHTASSAAVISYPKSRMDMVRVGILAYGFWPTRETFIHYVHKKENKSDPLRRAIRWKSKIMSVKSVPAGSFVGYGFGYQAQDDTTVALVPVGYADGYSRMLSNNGHVLLKGQRADVIGTVNMNMILINCSQIPDVNIGDEVVLLGSQGDHEITVASFAEMNNSMNYELLARLPGSIKRKLV